MQQALAFLLGLQNTDGGWPYVTGESAPEATCAALLALPGGERAARQRGGDWLQNQIQATGALTLSNDSDPHWTTSLALFTLDALAAPAAIRERGLAYLLTWEGVRVEPDPAIPLDPRLRGWPWTEGAFSWVEPTAYALLALKRAGYATHARVLEGERLLLDRQCNGGGWNYGNREVLGKTLQPMIHTTAWALLALQGAAEAVGAVKDGLAVLEAGVARYPSTLTLSLTILANLVWGQPIERWVILLRQRQAADGSWRQQVYLTALAVLALRAAEGGEHVFQL